ncbi:MAG: hypothetical protein HZA35_00920 [Parcubacteria group bacterium]|nr:hypothetical protein [Parcubacteria group bacterium]
MKFIEKHKLSDTTDLSQIPLVHPKTGKKIYVVSSWFSGFWYRRKPGSVGRVYPYQYYGSLLELEVHPDADAQKKK